MKWQRLNDLNTKKTTQTPKPQGKEQNLRILPLLVRVNVLIT